MQLVKIHFQFSSENSKRKHPVFRRCYRSRCITCKSLFGGSARIVLLIGYAKGKVSGNRSGHKVTSVIYYVGHRLCKPKRCKVKLREQGWEKEQNCENTRDWKRNATGKCVPLVHMPGFSIHIFQPRWPSCASPV